MTDTTYAPAPFTIAPLAPLAPAPVSSGGSGPGLGARISNDWSDSRIDRQAQNRQDRRSAVKRARAKVEKDWDRPTHQTKAERLAAAKSKGERDVASPKERAATLATVQKAMAAVSGIPSDTAISEPEARAVRAVLRQRYPGRKLSEMIATAEQLDAALKHDPVAGYDRLVAHYAHGILAENLPTFRKPEHVEGLRGSLQRARQDQEDAEDLAAASAKWGAGLNQIIKQIELFDRAMLENPTHTAARLAVAAGAPAVQSEIEPYKARMAAKEQAAYAARLHSDRCKGIQMAIEHGLLPDFYEPGVADAIVAVMQHPDFRPHPTDQLHTLLHAHHVALQLVRGEPKSDAGSRSIAGGSPSANHTSPRGPRSPGTGGARASIDRAMAQ